MGRLGKQLEARIIAASTSAANYVRAAACLEMAASSVVAGTSGDDPYVICDWLQRIWDEKLQYQTHRSSPEIVELFQLATDYPANFDDNFSQGSYFEVAGSWSSRRLEAARDVLEVSIDDESPEFPFDDDSVVDCTARISQRLIETFGLASLDNPRGHSFKRLNNLRVCIAKEAQRTIGKVPPFQYGLFSRAEREEEERAIVARFTPPSCPTCGGKVKVAKTNRTTRDLKCSDCGHGFTRSK